MLRGATRIVPVTLADLCTAIAVLTVVIAKNFPGLLEVTLLARRPITASMRNAVASITRNVIMVVGTIVAFGAVGGG